MGSWTDLHEFGGSGMALLLMTIVNKNTNSLDQYGFLFTWPNEPKVGDVLSKAKDFELTPDVVDSQINGKDFTYSSGAATVVSTDKSNWSITIQFNNLKMVNSSHSLTFNGTVALPFNFK